MGFSTYSCTGLKRARFHKDETRFMPEGVTIPHGQRICPAVIRALIQALLRNAGTQYATICAQNIHTITGSYSAMELNVP
jgi:hypothetical protein